MPAFLGKQGTNVTYTLNNFIGGVECPPESGVYMDRHAPQTGAKCSLVASSAAADVDRAVRAAAAAQPAWAALKPIERGRILMRMATYLRENLDTFMEIDRRETGKPDWQLPHESGGAADYLEFYAGLGNLDSGDVVDIGDGYHAYTMHEPYGVIGVITPWNSPLGQFSRGAATALITGNTVVSKPSEFTSASSLHLAKAAVEHCGLPPGVINVVLGSGPEAGAAVVAHPLVRKVAFTGSVRAGREIGKMAGERIIPATMELGGKSPNIVFDDADIEKAVPGSLMAFALNAGQICYAGTRCLVQRSIHDKFVETLRAAVAQVKVGPEPDALIGAIATRAQYERVLSFYDIAKDDGATLLAGGPDEKLDSWGEGWFVPLTVYGDVTNDMSLAREEIFGPILSVIPFDTEEEAIAIANDTDYGLGAGIWTTDLARAHRVAKKVEAGTVMVNEYLTNDVELPFGGFKNSGYGKEKGLESLHHYTRTKTVRMKL